VPASLLLFPQVSHRSESRVTPFPRSEALVELAPSVYLTHPQATQRHLDALAALVAHCRCYRLETGTDLEAACRLIAELAGDPTDG
jgi:hypothetical protein